MAELRDYTSLRVGGPAQKFVEVGTESQIIAAIEAAGDAPILIMGGGTNLLIADSGFNGVVIRITNHSLQAEIDACSGATLTIGAGEDWDEFVATTIDRGFAGLETLSGIPGTVGAAPIQNIGAYGVEAKETIQQITAYDTHTKQWVILDNDACQFSYRNSLFKKEKNRYIIAEVQFLLQKQPTLHTDYGVIREVLHQKQIKQASIEDISNAIIEIRTDKLPDPSILGNAGSFFKNPTVNHEIFNKIKEDHPTLVAFPISNNEYKIAAGWLIEQAGWKGKKQGSVGCYEKQALVIVNYDQATGKEIYNFSEAIIQSVNNMFGIQLEREVNIF